MNSTTEATRSLLILLRKKSLSFIVSNCNLELAIFIRHRTNQDFWVSGTVENWEREMADMRTMIEFYTGIPVDKIKGARAPFLNMGKRI